MASFDTVNYSLRPNKAIQRQIVFDGLELIDRVAPFGTNCVYIGFGSIWFSDFVLAHRRLGIREMISIEKDPLGATRAKFNAPFKTVKIEPGDSNTVLAALLQRQDLIDRRWIVWLDYDRGLTPEALEDVRMLLTDAPPGSVLLLTMNASPGSLGDKASKRQTNLRQLLGDAVPDDIDHTGFEKDRFQSTLATSLERYLIDQATTFGSPGGFVPTFRLPYRDATPMVTIGGVLPPAGARNTIRNAIRDHSWPGFPQHAVEAPPLTIKEIAALQTLLPSSRKVKRSQVRRLGFDLEDAQLETYCEHYRRYPAFFQVVT